MRELPKERLDNIVSLVTDKTSGRKDPTKPYLGLEHLPSRGSTVLGMSAAEDSVSINNKFQSGDILFGKLRPRLRKSVRVQFDGYCSTDILVLRATGEAHPPFAGVVLQSDVVFSEAIRTEEGTKMPRCSWGMLRKLPVFCPDKDSQRGIAEIFSTVDEAIEQTETFVAKTQQIKAGLMHDLFTRGVTPDGHLRPPREEAPKLYKESPLGWIPREWEAGRLYDKRRSGRPHLKTGPFGSSLKLEHWVEDGRPVITIGALGEGEFLPSELLHVSEETAERLSDYQLDVGDVVFSRVADVGRSAAIGEEQTGWIMSSNLMRISLDRRLVVPAFLQAQLAYDASVRRQIRATVNAGGRDVANSAILNRLSFSWPLEEEQERIVSRFAGLESSRRANVVSLEKLRLIKAGLMQDLLTGRVRVPVADAQKVAANV